MTNRRAFALGTPVSRDDLAEAISAITGTPEGQSQAYRSFRPDRIKTVHRVTKMRSTK